MHKKINPHHRFETLVTRFMNEKPLQGRSFKRTWAQSVLIVCERWPEVYDKYLKQLAEIRRKANDKTYNNSR